MTIEQDAQAFGQHFEVGWQLGLLVARNVYKRAGAGRPSKSEPVRNKLSCNQFAKLAGVSERTVQLVYDTWRLAAEEGHCTPPDQLLPGMDDPKLSGFNTTDQEHREMWRKFYRQTRESRAGKASGRTGSTRRKAKASSAHSQRDEQSESPSPESDPKVHPLYGLLLSMNHLSDALKRGGSSASIAAAADEVATRQNRAALRRAIGVL